MALAEMTHHTAPKGTKDGQSRGGGARGVRRATTTEPPPPQPELFKLFEEEPGGVQPEAFTEPRPQERVQRHTMEQLADVAPMVPSLAVPESHGDGHGGGGGTMMTLGHSFVL